MTDQTTKPSERIAKRMARAGLCSRREAETWIRAGRVAVDGKTLDSPAFTVTADSRITVDGKPVAAAEATRLWRYHKPRGLLTTNRDIRGRPIIFDHLPDDLPRVVTVGRLDMNSEGLLLLTNDGELARRLELPATGWVRRYRVRVRGQVDVARLEALEKGIEIEGVRYGPIRAALDRQLENNAWLTMGLNEGKNREVRRVCEHLGWPVLRLIRVAYGPFQLGNLPEGAVSEAPASVLRDQLGVGGKKGRGKSFVHAEPAEPAGVAKKPVKTRRDGSVAKAKPVRPRNPPPPSPASGRGSSTGRVTKKSPARAEQADIAGRGRAAQKVQGGIGEGAASARKAPAKPGRTRHKPRNPDANRRR